MITDVTASHKHIVFTLNFLIYLMITIKITKEQIVNDAFYNNAALLTCCRILLAKLGLY